MALLVCPARLVLVNAQPCAQLGLVTTQALQLLLQLEPLELRAVESVACEALLGTQMIDLAGEWVLEEFGESVSPSLVYVW